MAKKGNNEGSIYKDKQGHWRGVVSIPSTDGKSKRKYFYGKTRKEVSDKVNTVLNQIQSNAYIEPCKINLYSWLSTWLETYCINDVRMTTYVNYETYVNKHIKNSIGGYKLCDISPVIIQQFYNEIFRNGRLDGNGGLSPKTIKNLHNMLHKALGQAVALQMIPKNPTDYVTIPKGKKQEMKYFTVEEQQKLQKSIKGERLEMAVILALYTGIRQGELLGLPWKNVHIDLEGQSYIKITQTLNRIKNPDLSSPQKTLLCINEPKTPHSKRIIPLIPAVAEKLAEYQKEQAKFFETNGFPPYEFVFYSTTGTLIDPRAFQTSFKLMLKRHNIREINVHGLRHTFATRSLESGMSVKTLSKILGHSNVGFTLDTYAHVTETLKIDEISNLKAFL